MTPSHVHASFLFLDEVSAAWDAARLGRRGSRFKAGLWWIWAGVARSKGGQTYLGEELQFDLGASTAAGTPERSDDHFVFVEGVVEMAGDLPHVSLFALDMSLRRCGETDATRRQRDLSS